MSEYSVICGVRTTILNNWASLYAGPHVSTTSNGRVGLGTKNRERLLAQSTSDSNRSGPVRHLTALNGGSTNHTGRLCSDDHHVSGSGRPQWQGRGLWPARTSRYVT